jgi:hypothetical protein
VQWVKCTPGSGPCSGVELRTAKMTSKPEIRRISSAVNQVLWDVWDPIGVNTCADAHGEYDSYVCQIVKLLLTNASDDQIAEYLSKEASEHMGLNYQRERAYPTVVALRRIAIKGDVP